MAKNVIHSKISNLIDVKATEMNPDALYCCKSVSMEIKQINNFIAGTIKLSENRIYAILDNLVGYYTITLDLQLDKKTKIFRAVKYNEFNNKSCHDKVSRLSYKSPPTTIGRLNRQNESMYYGCLHFNDKWGDLNVAFSEINALKYEKINILKSEVTDELKVNYIGIYNYIKRNEKPYFLPKKVYAYFKDVYEYEENKFNKYVFTAFQLCDAFFSDILRRKESDRLYVITSMLASLFLEGDRVDGLIYTSVKVEGSPVIAIKPISVDNKIDHKEAMSFGIQENYSYAIYKAKLLHQGLVNGEKIDWI